MSRRLQPAHIIETDMNTSQDSLRFDLSLITSGISPALLARDELLAKMLAEHPPITQEQLKRGKQVISATVMNRINHNGLRIAGMLSKLQSSNGNTFPFTVDDISVFPPNDRGLAPYYGNDFGRHIGNKYPLDNPALMVSTALTGVALVSAGRAVLGEDGLYHLGDIEEDSTYFMQEPGTAIIYVSGGTHVLPPTSLDFVTASDSQPRVSTEQAVFLDKPIQSVYPR